MLEIKSKAKSYGINFPTSVEEITPEVLENITKGVKLPKYYCIVALCFKTKLFEFVTAIDSKRETNVSVVPILAKISEEDAKDINTAVGDKLIIDRSSLERGSHLNLPVMIGSNNASKYIKSDNDLVRTISSGNFNKPKIDLNINKSLIPANSPTIVVLEFKIVPINTINASVPVDHKVEDPFIINYVTN